jgi:AGZA family xanthine/uracil permease-like MFS transporter
MPLTASITDGIAFGLISLVVLKAAARRFREVDPVAAAFAAVFLLRYVFNLR